MGGVALALEACVCGHVTQACDQAGDNNMWAQSPTGRGAPTSAVVPARPLHPLCPCCAPVLPCPCRFQVPVLKADGSQSIVLLGVQDRVDPFNDDSRVFVGTMSFDSHDPEVQGLARQVQQGCTGARLQEAAAPLEHKKEPMIVITVDGTIELANAACRAFLGLDDGIIGQNIRQLMPEPFSSHHDGFLQRFSAGIGPTPPYQSPPSTNPWIRMPHFMEPTGREGLAQAGGGPENPTTSRPIPNPTSSNLNSSLPNHQRTRPPANPTTSQPDHQ